VSHRETPRDMGRNREGGATERYGSPKHTHTDARIETDTDTDIEEISD